MGVDLAAIPQRHTDDLFALGDNLLHASYGPNPGTGLCGQARQLFGDAAHPAFRDHPRTVRAWQAAHVMHQKIHPRGWGPEAAMQAGEAIGDGIHGEQELAGKTKPRQIILHRSCDQIDERFTQSRAEIFFRRVIYGERLFQPTGSQIFSDLSDFSGQCLVSFPVPFGEER